MRRRRAALLSVFGGKITTLSPAGGGGAWRSWRRTFPACAAIGPPAQRCPVATFPGTAWRRCARRSQRRYPFLPAPTLHRLVRSYGTLVPDMLGEAASGADLGTCFGADLTAREVAWLRATEWARTTEDVLWRRSKLGLRFSPPRPRRSDVGWARARSLQAESP